MNTIFIKFGGSVITDKFGESKANIRVLDQLVCDLVKFADEHDEVRFVIGHGAGSFGHKQAMSFLSRLPSLGRVEIEKELLEIHESVMQLNEIVAAMLNPLKNYVLEIVHGDVNFEGPPYIVSTEEQFLKILPRYDATRIILVTDQPGVMRNGVVCSVLLPEDEVSFSAVEDATGGMSSKVQAAFEMLSSSGVSQVNIIGIDMLPACLRGEKVGTTIQNVKILI